MSNGNQGVHQDCSAWALAAAICDGANDSYNVSLDKKVVKTLLTTSYQAWEGASLLDAVNGWNSFMENTTNGNQYVANEAGRFRFFIEHKKFTCFADT